MGKRTATATPAENNFAKAYLELLKLREDVEHRKIVEVAPAPTNGSQ